MLFFLYSDPQFSVAPRLVRSQLTGFPHRLSAAHEALLDVFPCACLPVPRIDHPFIQFI
jgi:hypothetical protein